MQYVSFVRIALAVFVGGLGACIEIPPEIQNMDNPNSTRYEAACNCYATGTGLMTTHLVKTCDVPAHFVDEFETAQRLQALCDESDSQFTNCELEPFLAGRDGNTGCGSVQSCVPYGCCYAYGPTCSMLQCTDSVLLEDGDLNCLDSSSRVAPSAGPAMWSHATITSGTLQISTTVGNGTTQVTGSLAFIGGNCTTGTCPFEVVDLSLDAVAFDLQGHTISDPHVINDTAAAGFLFANAGVFMLPSQSLEVYATATIEGDRHGLVAASDTPGVGLIDQASRQLVFTQSFDAYGDAIDIHLTAAIENLAPTVSLPSSPTIECNSAGGANVTIAAAANDVDGHIVSAQWFVDGSLAAGTTTTLETFLPLGTHQLEVAVFDNDGALATASATVDVIDTTPPVLSFDTLCLWPPNHKLYAIDAADLHVIDACDPNATVKFVSGSSDQPDDGTGDGNTDDDLVVKPDSVCARAERDGGVATGRTYTITAIATDGATNQGQLTFEIVVPHNHSTTCVSGGEAVDDSDPRCIPSPAIAPEQAIAAAALPVAEESHAGSGCDAGGRAQGIGLVLVLVAPLPLRRRRRRQAE